MKYICDYCHGEFDRIYRKGYLPKHVFCNKTCHKNWVNHIPLKDANIKKMTPDIRKFMKVFDGKYPTDNELKQYLKSKKVRITK